MRAHDLVTLLSCAGQLALTLVVLLRGEKSPLSRPLALMCMAFFAFNAADLAGHFSDARGWAWLDLSAASIAPALVFHFVLAFVGKRRSLGVALALVYLIFGAIAVAAVFSFSFAWARAFTAGSAWPTLMVAFTAPLLLWTGQLVFAHLRRTSSPLERGRTYLVGGAFVIGAAGCVSDLLAQLAFPVPRLAAAGTLAATLLLATVALRWRLFERRVSSLFAVNAAILGGLQVLAYLAVFRYLRAHQALLLFAAATVTAVLVPLARDLLGTFIAHRQRLEYLATLGRFSAQMAHDLKNPLAALKGATQYLQEEATRGATLQSQEEFLDLMAGQIDRMTQVIGTYQRLGRVEAALAPVEINALVDSVVASQTLAAPAGVDVKTRLSPERPRCRADRDLLAGALENLVRNAYEAMPAGGALRVTTAIAGGFVTIAVEDTGSGMDPRVSDRAFDDFFTTKAGGSGLGLSFVRRVAEAHGGDASLDSTEGKGTRVALRLPVPEESQG